jgi:hypothetical protein
MSVKDYPVGPTAPHDQVATITPGDVRWLLMETATSVLRDEVTPTQADRIVRDCRRITRELNQRAGLVGKDGALVARTEAKINGER